MKRALFLVVSGLLFVATGTFTTAHAAATETIASRTAEITASNCIT